MSCHDCENGVTEILGGCSGCGEHICENCSTDLVVPFSTCPTLFETAKFLELIKNEEEIRCNFCLYELLASVLEFDKVDVREKIIEEILNELVFFSDSFVETLLFPEEGKQYRGKDFDWSKYNRFVEDPFDIIQGGDQILYDIGRKDRFETDTVVSKENGVLKVSKGGVVKSSKVRTVYRNDKDWYRIDDSDTFNRTVWLHESRQNNKE